MVNVTSSVTLAPMPLAAAYTASKMAIEGFTGSLAHELAAFDVRVKLVEPGYGPTTRFAQNTDVRIEDLIPEAYAAFAEPIFAAFARAGHGDEGVRRGRGGVACRERSVRAAPFSGRTRRRGTGARKLKTAGVDCCRRSVVRRQRAAMPIPVPICCARCLASIRYLAPDTKDWRYRSRCLVPLPTDRMRFGATKGAKVGE